MKTLNVGVIGAGFMGKAPSLAYAAMPMFFWPSPALPHRKIIAEITEDRAKEAARRFGYESYTADWRRVVEDRSIDIVDIATPNNTHPEIAIAALEAGKHVICEKPLASRTEQARMMCEAARKAGVVHTGPAHPYGGGLWPIPALGIGYGETKIIECYDLFKAIVDGTSASPDFRDGYQIARIEAAIQDSSADKVWVDIPPLEDGA